MIEEIPKNELALQLVANPKPEEEETPKTDEVSAGLDTGGETSPAPSAVANAPVETLPETPEDKSGVTTAGRLVTKTKKSGAELLDKTRTYHYPTVKNGQLTDYGKTEVTLQQVAAMQSEGVDPQKAFEQVGDEREQFKYKVLMTNKLRNKMDMTEEEALAEVGLDPRIAGMARSDEFMKRYRLAVEAQTTKISSGVQNIITTGSEAVYGQNSPFHDPTLQPALQQMRKSADDTHARAEGLNIMSRNVSDYYKYSNRTYNEVTGQASEPLDIQSFAGDVTIETAISIPGAFVKGASIGIKATNEAIYQVGSAFMLETARAGHDKSISKFALGMVSTLATESLSLWLTKRFLPRDVTELATRDVTELDDVLNGLGIAKKANLDIGSEDLMEPENIARKIQERLDKGMINSAEANQLLTIYKGRNVELLNSTKQTLESMGIKDVDKLRAFKEGRISLGNMPAQFKHWWKIRGQEAQAQLGPLYKEVEDLAKTNGGAGGPATWNTDTLREEMLSVTHSSPEVNSLVNRAMNFVANNPDVGDAAKNKVIETYYGSHRKLSSDLVKFNASLMKAQDAFGTAEKEMTALKLAQSRESNPAIRASLGRKILHYDTVRDQAKKDISKFRLQRGKTSSRITKLEDDYSSTIKGYEDAAVTGEFDFNQLIDLRKIITQKMYRTGGNINTRNELQQEQLEEALKAIDKFIDTRVAATDPNLVAKFRVVTKKAAENFNSFGNSSVGHRIRQAIKEGSDEQLAKFFTGENAREYLRYLKQAAGPDSKIYKNMVAKTLDNKIMKGVIQGKGVRDSRGFDYKKFAENIRSPETRELVNETLGREAYKELTGMAWLADTLGPEYQKAIDKVGELLNVSARWNPKLSKSDTLKNRTGFRLAWLVERYTGGLFKTRYYTGRTNMGNIGGAIRNALADMIQIKSHITPLIPNIDNRTYTINQAIRDVKRVLNGIKDPKEKSQFINDLIEKIDEKITNFSNTAVEGTRNAIANSNRMRPAHLGFSNASSSLPGKNKGAKFDLRNIAPEDRKFMGFLKEGDTIVDMSGNTFKKKVVKTKGKPEFVEVARDPNKKLITHTRSSLDTAPTPPRNKFQIFHRGKIYESTGKPVTNRKITWEPVERVEGGRLQVDSTTQPGVDTTKRYALTEIPQKEKIKLTEDYSEARKKWIDGTDMEVEDAFQKGIALKKAQGFSDYLAERFVNYQYMMDVWTDEAKKAPRNLKGLHESKAAGYRDKMDKLNEYYRKKFENLGVNPGSAMLTSPLDDAIYNLRMNKGKIPNSASEWINYLKFQGVSKDELVGSRVMEKMNQAEEANIPLTLENVETMLNDRWDKIYKTTLKDGKYTGYMPQKYKNDLNYKENIYTSKVGDDLVTANPNLNELTKVRKSRQAHFGIKKDPETGGYFGHTRNVPYTTEDGGKGKVIGELQSDLYQNLAGDVRLDPASDLMSVAKDLREIQNGDSSFMKTLSMFNGGRDELTRLNDNLEQILDVSYINDINVADEVIDYAIKSPNPIVDLNLYLDDKLSKQEKRILINDVMREVHAKQAELINSAQKGATGDIPYGEGWFQTIGARELVDAYNEGYSEVKIPIGRFIDADPKGAKASWRNLKGSRASVSDISKVADEMARGPGPTKWYTTTVKNWLEKVGLQIDAKDVTYDEVSEMLTIKLPDKPFNITTKGTGSVPSGSTNQTQIHQQGEAYIRRNNE